MALLDPSATLSLVCPDIAKRFEDRMVDTSTRIRTVTGNVTRALGNLPFMVEVDGKLELIVFRAIAELSKSLFLEWTSFDYSTLTGVYAVASGVSTKASGT